MEMTAETETADEFLAQFTDSDHIQAKDVPEAIMEVLRYIDSRTGLTGDYNDGLVQLAEGGDTIQVYPRSRTLSSHDNLLQWLQLEADDVMLGVVTTRPHPEKDDETHVYVEVHEKDRWSA